MSVCVCVYVYMCAYLCVWVCVRTWWGVGLKRLAHGWGQPCPSPQEVWLCLGSSREPSTRSPAPGASSFQATRRHHPCLLSQNRLVWWCLLRPGRIPLDSSRMAGPSMGGRLAQDREKRTQRSPEQGPSLDVPTSLSLVAARSERDPERPPPFPQAWTRALGGRCHRGEE